MKTYYYTFLDQYINEIFRVDGFLFETPVGFISVDEFGSMTEWSNVDEFESHLKRLYCFTFEMVRLQ